MNFIVSGIYLKYHDLYLSALMKEFCCPTPMYNSYYL